MKRKDLIQLLEENGWRLKRNGARHREIDEELAKTIIKRQGLK